MKRRTYFCLLSLFGLAACGRDSAPRSSPTAASSPVVPATAAAPVAPSDRVADTGAAPAPVSAPLAVAPANPAPPAATTAATAKPADAADPRAQADAEAEMDARLASVRAAVAAYFADKGYYPDSLSLLNAQLDGALPMLWDTRGALGVSFPHPASNNAGVAEKRDVTDSGRYVLIKNDGGEENGTVFVDCSHVAADGHPWSEH
jgi:hypothetical protein